MMMMMPAGSFANMSRKSTAMSNDLLSETYTPQKNEVKRVPSRTGSGRASRDGGARVQNSERGSELLENASVEAITLSLDPKAAKKKKQFPRTLKPIEKTANGKIAGNYAAEVLADLEHKQNNRQRTTDLKNLDKEVNRYLKFDA